MVSWSESAADDEAAESVEDVVDAVGESSETTMPSSSRSMFGATMDRSLGLEDVDIVDGSSDVACWKRNPQRQH